MGTENLPFLRPGCPAVSHQRGSRPSRHHPAHRNWVLSMNRMLLRKSQYRGDRLSWNPPYTLWYMLLEGQYFASCGFGETR